MAVVVQGGPSQWTAMRDGRSVGGARVLLRPDQRRFVVVRTDDDDGYGPLLRAAVRATPGALYAHVNDAERGRLDQLAAHGFVVHRREHTYAVSTDPVWTGLAGRVLPEGFDAVSAADVDIDRHRELDDALRQDVPGTQGWRTDPADFHGMTLGDADFDSAMYLIAVERSPAGRYVGLARAWRRPGNAARLGLVGALAGYRRRGIAAALLARVLDALHCRGCREATADVDQDNTASNALMAAVGARRTGGSTELIRPTG